MKRKTKPDFLRLLLERRDQNARAETRLRSEIAALERENAEIATERRRQIAFLFDPLGR